MCPKWGACHNREPRASGAGSSDPGDESAAVRLRWSSRLRNIRFQRRELSAESLPDLQTWCRPRNRNDPQSLTGVTFQPNSPVFAVTSARFLTVRTGLTPRWIRTLLSGGLSRVQGRSSCPPEALSLWNHGTQPASNLGNRHRWPPLLLSRGSALRACYKGESSTPVCVRTPVVFHGSTRERLRRGQQRAGPGWPWHDGFSKQRCTGRTGIRAARPERLTSVYRYSMSSR